MESTLAGLRVLQEESEPKKREGEVEKAGEKKKRRQPRDSCLILRECHKKADFA